MAVASPTTTQPIEVKKVDDSNNAAAAPKKRRRRAPATGATEDCFSCKKRSIKCDRRRPYCGQCVEIGKDCTGYRTTLTWGVGVASRGKLRGMSLPIAKSPPATATTATRKESSASTSGNNASSSASQHSSSFNSRASVDFGIHSPTSPMSPGSIYSAPQEYQYFGPTSPIPIPSPSTPLGYPMQSPREHFEMMHPLASKMRRPSQLSRGPLQRLHTSIHLPFDEGGLSASTASLGTYSDSDFPSPGEYPHTPADEFPFADPSIPRYSPIHSYDQAQIGSIDSFYHEAPRSLPMADDMSSSVSSDQSLQDYVEVSSAQQNMGQAVFHDAVFVEGDASSSYTALSQPAFSFLPSEGTSMSSYGSGPLSLDVLALTTSIPQSLAIASPLSHRMLSLMDYYDKFICPVLVAFDGPSNPYRMHIIHLAMQNDELQNAIAALATNNMRMRGGLEGRRLSAPGDYRLIPQHAYSQMTAQELREMHGEPTSEEKHYKAQSIALLNRKLVDINGSQDDSVLATLLILCLFHVCDSGFTKFKTQLAGVQKLLAMRDRTVQSEFVGWIELFFTWFDVMTAAVNDREIEVRGDSLDMMNLTANLGALEHHSGCEGRLFKLIARLGRLNLLSQNRPVRENDDTPQSSPRPKKMNDFYSFNFDQIDGNGWGTPIIEFQDPFASAREDPRSPFWVEWNDVRVRLQEWEFGVPGENSVDSCEATSSMLAMTPNDAALLHISESFRYAALLYIERLAHPTVPAGALNFQNLVAQGLYHISQIGITSCVNKFLLWPLFIVGTECVDAEHRAVVRQRCVEIQRESGFFNNLSGLEVLERVWQDDDEWLDGDMQSSRHGPFGTSQQAFRWRKAMDRIDGEYIVI
ncbi:fungal-specific transcription factor domain-containing protein [Boeremia exigua]|uniref:fungal-specific transcription factor domain-containing protein n=1 Tax=Boeremia exigua TaxID=749465 RepID=UPI001E8D08D3|nr:fungal-specific transcription factor domain-containing protein [Boeremia exigua]KAH6618890.1 fungal-specific transcription factor domain-containing protein [Boeremia exigua]